VRWETLGVVTNGPLLEFGLDKAGSKGERGRHEAEERMVKSVCEVGHHVVAPQQRSARNERSRRGRFMAAVSALALCLAVVAVVGGGGEARHTDLELLNKVCVSFASTGCAWRSYVFCLRSSAASTNVVCSIFSISLSPLCSRRTRTILSCPKAGLLSISTTNS
jgi:hypothetical protein